MFSLPLLKKSLRPALIALGAIFVFLGSYFRVFELYELQTYDWRCQIRGPRPVSSDIVLIDIWNDSLKELGAWPFDREYHANLIQILKESGAKAVVFDVLFSDPAPHDEELIQAAKEAQNTYFAVAFANPKLQKGSFFATGMDDLVPGYRQAAKGVGFVNAKADIDGKRRRTFPVISYQDKNYYQLIFRLAADLSGSQGKDLLLKPRQYIELSPGLKVPLDEDSCFIISYAGLWEKTFQHYSYLDVIYSYLQSTKGEKPRIDLSSLKDKICIVGLTSLGSHDISPIPIQSVYPMVGSYANILNDILQKDFIRRANRWENLFLLLLFVLLVAWISSHEKPIRALFFTLGMIGFFTGMTVFLFCAAGWWLDLFYPVVVLAVLYAGTTLSRMLSEMRKRELIESELKIASQIQKSFLPESMPEIPKLSLAVYFRPAKAVGGDLYAFIRFPDENKLGVMVGDVSGKGTPAALFMAKAVSEFKFSARDCLDPSKALETLNDAISSETTGGLFVTLSYAIFDIRAYKFVLSNGGHLPVVKVDAQGKSELLNAEEGMPIGVMPGVPFANFDGSLLEGDVFAFYSDGVSEARNRKKEEYGIEKLQNIMSINRSQSADKILSETVKDLDQFMGKADQHDDITLIIVKMDTAV